MLMRASVHWKKTVRYSLMHHCWTSETNLSESQGYSCFEYFIRWQDKLQNNPRHPSVQWPQSFLFGSWFERREGGSHDSFIQDCRGLSPKLLLSVHKMWHECTGGLTGHSMLIAILDPCWCYPISVYIPDSFVQPWLNGHRRSIHGHLQFTSSTVQPWLNEWRKKRWDGVNESWTIFEVNLCNHSIFVFGKYINKCKIGYKWKGLIREL